MRSSLVLVLLSRTCSASLLGQTAPVCPCWPRGGMGALSSQQRPSEPALGSDGQPGHPVGRETACEPPGRRWAGAGCLGRVLLLWRPCRKVPSPGPAARGQTAPLTLTLTHSLFGSCWHLHATLTAPSQRLVQTSPGAVGALCAGARPASPASRVHPSRRRIPEALEAGGQEGLHLELGAHVARRPPARPSSFRWELLGARASPWGGGQGHRGRAAEALSSVRAHGSPALSPAAPALAGTDTGPVRVKPSPKLCVCISVISQQEAGLERGWNQRRTCPGGLPRIPQPRCPSPGPGKVQDFGSSPPGMAIRKTVTAAG